MNHIYNHCFAIPIVDHVYVLPLRQQQVHLKYTGNTISPSNLTLICRSTIAQGVGLVVDLNMYIEICMMVCMRCPFPLHNVQAPIYREEQKRS